MNLLPLPDRYHNPILNFDVPDPDAIRLPGGGYALVASSFDRRPGLPLWHSDDLVNWSAVGHVGGTGARTADGGVWAPSIRSHDGRLHVVWGDPDRGIFASSADALPGPWDSARLVVAGQGLIDPCPAWDDHGRAFIVHGWARSRAGFANRLDMFEVDSSLTRPLSPSRPLIDGDLIAGCSVLEGPKVYRRASQWWIFAPAGGVATGWQYAFRADRLDGPWEHRIVLSQGATAINGPHQGAWVEGTDGEEWFLHFQATPRLGRVLHLQPLRWGSDGWPLIGSAVTGGPAEPVEHWALPTGGKPPARPRGDSFASPRLSPIWHTRGADATALISSLGEGTLELRASGDGVLAQPLHGDWRTWSTTVLGADAAALVVDGEERWLLEVADSYATVWCGSTLHARVPASTPVELAVSFDQDRVQFLVEGHPLGSALQLRPRRWTGVEIGLQARHGSARFAPVRISVGAAPLAPEPTSDDQPQERSRSND